jgi:hypothetical protein
MKTNKNIRLMLTTATLGLLGSAAHASERWATLQAINWVENPTNHTRMGAHGELGPYQFRVGTWRMHTARPFSLAVQRPYADEVAVKHYDWLRTGLLRAGIQPIPYNIALAWNGGLEAVVSGRAVEASHRYAQQVQNLVEKLRQMEAVSATDRPQAEVAAVAPAPRFEIADSPSRFTIPFRGPRFTLAAN